MITAIQKPFEEIAETVKEYEKLLILGCGTCVTVCMAGGEKEVEILASTLRLANKKNGASMEIQEDTIERQCDREFFDTVKEHVKWADHILVMEKNHRSFIEEQWPEYKEKVELIGKYISPDMAEDDVIDPYGGSPYHYRLAQSQISLAVKSLLHKLRAEQNA